MLQGLLFLIVLLMAATAVAAYLFGEELGLEPTRGLYLSRRATRHLGTLAALLLIVLAFGAWLQIPQLLLGTIRQHQPARPTPMCTPGCRRCGCSSAPRCCRR